ncbi:MAG: argininosuccinate lyase [Alphaproteobacteria bacterium]|nr:MAG: argininosuccinate lyase [Alphaproteobacteria bacterium]
MAKRKKSLKSTIWGGRFEGESSDNLIKFNSSISFDKNLYVQDIEGSIAHAEMLSKQKIILKKDFLEIKSGLLKIKKEIETNKFKFKIELEDIHMNIESRLVELIGESGKKLHTARSRNDQVVTDFKMWIRSDLDSILELLKQLQEKLIFQAEDNYETLMPGYTHLQVAQPVTFGHHLLAYVEMFGRDRTRIEDCKNRMNECPLGSAALAGTSYPIDRNFVAKKLNFSSPTRNSIDSVSSRDFAIEYLSVLSLIGMNLSRIAEELILWSSNGFNFIVINEEYTTGSSIMPQKRNPDAAELIRGKSNRLVGNLINLTTLLKGLPLAYSKDLQEDKEPIFDSSENIKNCLLNMIGIIKSLKINKNKMLKALQRGFPTATDLADYLVTYLNIPFRDAHKITGKIILLAEKKNCSLDELSLEDLRLIEPKIESNIMKSISISSSILKKTSFGGTSPRLVLKAISEAKRRYL